VLYLATSPNQPEVADALNRYRIGLMCQPASNKPRAGWIWAADNGCFSDKWDETKWLRWLRLPHPRSGCLFATVPDVVGDAVATAERFARYVDTVREAGYPVAFVAQDGLTDDLLPWDDFDCLFVGGSTEFKMGDAFGWADEARDRGKWVHVGRVNSWSRYKAWASHAHSCDGTFLAFGPRKNLPRLLRWLDRHDESPQLLESLR